MDLRKLTGHIIASASRIAYAGAAAANLPPPNATNHATR